MINKVLIHISTLSNYPLISHLAAELIKRSKVYFFYDGDQPCLKEKIYNDFLQCEVIDYTNIVSITKIFFKKKPHKYTSSDERKFIIHFNESKVKLKAAKQVIKKIKPNIIITSDAGISGNHWLLTVAANRKIPVLVCPYEFSSSTDLENELSLRESDNTIIYPQGVYGNKVIKYYSHWLKKGKYANALFFVPEYIFALEKSGIKVPNPWTVPGGLFSKIAVESNRMLSHYLRESIPLSKLTVVGSVYCDLLYRTLQESKCYQIAYAESKPIFSTKKRILVCWPANYHSTRGKFCEFLSYEDLSQQVLLFFQSLSGIELTISLHPAIDSKNAIMIRDLGVTVSNEHVIDLIPKHDIYISCFSSTIRWAIAARKPVINYDFYGFRLADYDGIESVFYVDKFSDYKKTIIFLLEDKHYLAAAKKQALESVAWGNVDGDNFNRIYNLIENLIK